MKQNFTDQSPQYLSRLFPILLSPHNPDWNKEYLIEERFLTDLFSDTLCRISHIGSTFVPNLIAKPTVDILLEVKSNIDLSPYTAILEDAGYVVNQPENDLILYLKGYTPSGFQGQAFHIHVRNLGDWDELYFRDYLVEYPKVARGYEILKQKLKLLYEHDRDGYTNAKGDFVREHSKLARIQYGDRYLPKGKV